uniref:Uncharacterized protein n=1 Tax=Anguilla anguilla TaxID=7936 RepID=A0A0E9XXA4_ANGAN
MSYLLFEMCIYVYILSVSEAL